MWRRLKFVVMFPHKTRDVGDRGSSGAGVKTAKHHFITLISLMLDVGVNGILDNVNKETSGVRSGSE